MSIAFLGPSTRPKLLFLLAELDLMVAGGSLPSGRATSVPHPQAEKQWAKPCHVAAATMLKQSDWNHNSLWSESKHKAALHVSPVVVQKTVSFSESKNGFENGV